MNKKKKYEFDWKLEKYLLNEDNPELTHQMEEAIKSDKELKSKYEFLKKKNEEFFSKYPKNRFISDIRQKVDLRGLSGKIAIQRKPSQKKNRILYRFILIPSLSIIFVFFTIFLFNKNISIIDKIIPPENEITIANNISQYNNSFIREKGLRSHLLIFRKGDKKNERLKNLSYIKEGDIIQLCYLSSKKYGVIFSVDGNGVITLHFPKTKGSSTLLTTNKNVALNFSYKLDDAPYFEKFFFITSNSVFDINAVLASAKKIENIKDNEMKLTNNLEQYSIVLLKMKTR